MPLSVRSRLFLGAVGTATWSPGRDSCAWMHDTALYKKILRIDKPWLISQVTMDDAALTIRVLVEIRGALRVRA